MEDMTSLLRVGIVTDTDQAKRLVRVQYLPQEAPSDWLPVLVTGLREQVTDYTPGSDTTPAVENHRHTITMRQWMPEINEQVLVICEPISDGLGYVLGGIQKWQ